MHATAAQPRKGCVTDLTPVKPALVEQSLVLTAVSLIMTNNSQMSYKMTLKRTVSMPSSTMCSQEPLMIASSRNFSGMRAKLAYRQLK